MSFTNIISKSKNEVIKYIENGNKINEKSLFVIANTIYQSSKKTNPELKYDDVLILLKQQFKIKYKLIDCEIDNKCLRDCEYLFNQIKIPKEYIKLQEHFEKLKNLPQPEQRTKEWFDYRHNRITASDTASAIDANPYEPVESFILKKCDPDHKFLDNANVYHGKKFEPTATSIYEYIHNIKVVEFGALPSDKYDILGASPDGICSCQTLDYQFSPLLGRMLEIKCTTTRKIYTSGKIAGHICPFYYYCQVQQQLECCDLEKCDFWQCNILEYNSREEYLTDECLNTKHTVGKELCDSIKSSKAISECEDIIIDKRIKKGVILKFLPKIWTPEFDGDLIDWKSKFIYPSNLLMNEVEYDSWIASTLSDWQKKYPDIAETHTYEKVIYWKLNSSHNVTITRDKQFFLNILPVLYDTWQKVLYYRENLDKLDELREIIKKRTMFKKFNTKININNIEMVNKRVLFLDQTKPIKNLKISSFDDTNEDFLD